MLKFSPINMDPCANIRSILNPVSGRQEREIWTGVEKPCCEPNFETFAKAVLRSIPRLGLDSFSCHAIQLYQLHLIQLIVLNTFQKIMDSDLKGSLYHGRV